MHIAHAQRAVAATRQAVSWVMSSTSMCTPGPLSVPPNRTTSPSLPNTPSPFHLFSSRSTLTGLPLALCATGTPATKLHRVVSETSPRRVRVCAYVQALCRSRTPLSRETATSSDVDLINLPCALLSATERNIMGPASELLPTAPRILSVGLTAILVMYHIIHSERTPLLRTGAGAGPVLEPSGAKGLWRQLTSHTVHSHSCLPLDQDCHVVA